jgi:hypothetical protein
VCVTKGRERGKGGRGRKASRKPKSTLREPTQQHRPTQNTAEAEKAAREHIPTETEKSNNRTQQKPEQTRPPRPPAQTLNANPRQRHKTAKQAGENKGRHAQGRHAGAGTPQRQSPPSPGSEEAHGPPVKREEGQQAAAMSNT